MKLVAIIFVTIWIASTFCVSLNKRTKKQVPTSSSNFNENNEHLSDAEVRKIFGPFEESPSSKASNNFLINSGDPVDSTASLDDELLKDIFGTIKEPPSTTSATSLTTFSVNQRMKSDEAATDDLVTIDPAILHDVFPDVNNAAKKEQSRVAARENKTTKQGMANLIEDSSTIDPAILYALFSDKEDISYVSSESPATLISGASTSNDTLNLKSDFSSRIGKPDSNNAKSNFVFIDIDWFGDDNASIETTTAEYRTGPRIHDSDVEHTKELTVENDKVIISYPIDEMVNPIEEHSVPTTTENSASTNNFDHTDNIEDATEHIDTYDDSTEVLPRECKYGTDEFPIPKPKVERKGRRIADIKCEEQMLHVKYNIYDVSKNNLTCDKLREISTILGGKRSRQKQFPHMGAVGWFSTENTPLFFCGSSLISARFSLTAAHCGVLSDRAPDYGVSDLFPDVVRFGNVDIGKEDEIIDVEIEKFITPNEYNPLLRYNDIALIRFNKDIQFSEFVRPACLWHKSIDIINVGNVTGWGQTAHGKRDSRSSHLLYAEVDIYKPDICNESLRNRHFRKWNGLSESQFCAGKLEGGVDTCQGDSGGPLQVQEPFSFDYTITLYHVVGITSFGFRCGDPKLPGVYTTVSKYLCWLEKNVWPSEENPCN